MKKPQMILFDYGQTLVRERKFDGVAGCRAVLQHAVKNKYNRTAEEVQAQADILNEELGRLDRSRRHLLQVEVPNHMFTAYLYQSMGIELALTPEQTDRVFWDAASPGVPTEGIEAFLAFLKEQGIRTGVISNISYCPEVVSERINRLLPDNAFEFILATSEYLFRKPNRRIFELALGKAEVSPEDAWYIGDHYRCDVVGARNAGMMPVWYTGAVEEKPEEQPDVLNISDWRQLEELLRSL